MEVNYFQCIDTYYLCGESLLAISWYMLTATIYRALFHSNTKSNLSSISWNLIVSGLESVSVMILMILRWLSPKVLGLSRKFISWFWYVCMIVRFSSKCKFSCNHYKFSWFHSISYSIKHNWLIEAVHLYMNSTTT